METNAFRLAHYKIMKNIGGIIWWESYVGFARTKSGRCFIESNVLFLEPAIEISETGFLIMEYNEALDKLPQWTKTAYYCTSYTLRFCCDEKIFYNKNTGKGFKRNAEEAVIAFEDETIGFDIDTFMSSGDIRTSNYQLGRYIIIEAVSGELRWSTCTHLNRLKVGRGIIEGNILFIDGEIIKESEFSKRQFFNRLEQLPKWKKTIYYCTSCALKPCQKTSASIEKQHGQPFNERFRYKRNSIITDRKAHKKSAFKIIAEIMEVIRTYKNRYFKRISK